MADNDDEGFDFIQPTLIQQLRTILDQYPDDGQILKELIQNAEDVCASQIKFLHDKHSFGTRQLYDEKLAKFQGPALYAYNNARFTKADWRGIRLVCDSIKVEDPMKVGRFGLGFKSAFHMTDLPSLISDRQIGFFDPHGVHFSDKRYIRTGKLWRLHEDRASMDEIPDQFLPYKEIFNCTDEVFSQGFYDGTLFRFPFRREPSELSETLYSAEKMDTLFESFKTDAPLILLFLQHLESIELYVREESESKPRKIFQVKVAEKSLQTVRAKRKEFREKITPGKVIPASITVTYPITIETVNFDSPLTDNTNQHSFLVTNYFCGGQVSLTFKRLMTDKDLSYLPTVGVAMALPKGLKLQTPAIKGHLFCFLPLPVQKTSLTGLPVHVNGCFALSQNRRYIKSPNADQEDREKAGRHLTDKSLLWNKCLVEEAIPRAYATMILEAIKEKSVFVSREAIYKAWPDISSIDQKWKGLEKPLFELLLKKDVVHTQAEGGKWVAVKNAYFQHVSCGEQNDLLLRVLLSVSLPATTVPTHVLKALDVYAPDKAEITPLLVRKVLRQVPSCYTSLDKTEKLLLLQFSLSDQRFTDLDSLQLLPLANGTFAKFDKRATTVYIASPEHPQELFPGARDRFLDTKVDEDILGNLRAAVFQGHTQLRFLSRDHVPALLRQSLPRNWKTGDSVSWYPDDGNHDHPPKDWIQLVWRYLRDHFSTLEEIQRLEDLPLIPLSMSQTPVTLARLSQPTRIVAKRFNYDCIGDTLANVLKKVGVIVLTDLPTFISHHPAVLGTFVNPPTVQGVLKAMVFSASTMTVRTFTEIVQRELSTKEKQVLRSFLGNVRPVYAGKEQLNLLGSIPIFETLSKRFVSKKDGLCAAPVEDLPVPPLRDLIDVSQDDSKTLAVLLKVRFLKPAELLCEMIFPDIQQGKYTEEEIDKLMPYVLKRYTQVIHTNVYFKWKIQVLPFVPTQRERVRASDVYDPRNHTLQTIFALEDVFPIGELYNDSTVLVMLEELGMKNESSIDATELLKSAEQVSMLSHLPTARAKSNSILQHLRVYPQKLEKAINGQQLGSLLMQIRWVPRLRQKPLNFPPSLPWWGRDDDEEEHGDEEELEEEKEEDEEEDEEDGKEDRYFFKPTELKSHQVVNLIGTVKPVTDVQPSDEVSAYFGWQKEPDVSDVIKHFQNVVTFYTKEDKPFYMVMLNEIYSFLSLANYDVLSQSFQWAEILDWVWNGDGFSSPNHVLFSRPPIDLSPYILPLPSEMMKHSHLFNRFGMRKKSDSELLLQVLGMIKEKHDGQNSRFDAPGIRHDLQLSVDILNEVAQEELSPEILEKILLPTHVEHNSYLRLEPVEHCMYCEHKEWLKRDVDDEEIEYFYVHSSVPNITAKRLGVPSLTHRMLDPEDLFIGKEFGQEEKLTTRLNRLLEDYKDGYAVLKELVQNADDAGATEVKFLYDERTNEDAMTCLIDEGMRGCQGPALWVYNDATFKDEDFVNITKLNEATKMHDTEKIGRFGLGFNAVYNLTDVPMFVSEHYFVILDPHTSYLGTAIKNKRKPGMKIDLNKDVKKLQKFKNQFKPFNGIFGCDLHLEKVDNSFDGTLFRFPLRTRKQAATSEIKKLCYDEREMRQLLEMFLERAKSLLLFTQNVFRVGMYYLPRCSGQILQPSLMFQVNKSITQGGIVRGLSFPVKLPATAMKLNREQQKLLQQCNFLQASSKVKRKAKERNIKPSEFPASSIKIDVECVFTNSGMSFFQTDKQLSQKCETWLVVSSMGNGKAMEFSKCDRSLLPSAGVAVQLNTIGSQTILPSSGDDGTIFCYLPLPIDSGLPVHINGAFAVASNRRHLHKKLEDDKTCYEVEWNDILMEDSISTAYLCLLEDLKQIIPEHSPYMFHSLWPKACEVRPECRPILMSFYMQIANGSHALFSDGNEWVDFSRVVFLHPDLRMDPSVGEISFAVFQDFHKENDVVVDLPSEVFQSFVRCGLSNAIESKTYNKSRFLSERFFPNILKVRSDLRDALVLDALNENNKECDKLIMRNACIPASPDGKILKRPSQMVSPTKEAASLYCPNDGRFPFGDEDTFCNPQLLTKLEELGMKSNDLPWEDIAERTESVRWINGVNSKAAMKRVTMLLEFLQRKTKHKGKCPSHGVLSRILEAEFLPVLQKPKSFPLPWKGEEQRSHRRFLAAPKDVFLKENMYLVCCTEWLVDLDIPKKVRELLKLDDKKVTTAHVIKQLGEAISANINALDLEGYEAMRNVCTEAYSFLQDNITSCTSSVKQFLLTKRFVLIGKRFLFANQVAFEVKIDCSPYLYQLPDDLSCSYFNILKFSGVRKHFEAKDYIVSLHEVKKQFNEGQLDARILQAAVNMAVQLGKTLEESDGDPCYVQKNWGCVYLPDSRGIMLSVPDLCYKDSPWMPDDPNEHFVHESIPWSTCSRLGVKTRREEALQQHDTGLPFGQKEELTNRLKRILTGYTGEKAILKELLQNADDAQATEICFIKDPRHHPDERVFTDSWKQLQGPALCVYNNRPFTNADIKGICNLGKGNKGEDPNMTGEYGVGFNAVYHLTDVPSFRSNGEEIGDVLCVFDPHCKYVSCANDANPGRMYKDIKGLKARFPDVLPCFLEKHFSIKNATMFRFPLRSEKMAEESKISQTPVTVEALDAMMEELKMELFQVLLFVNNVRKISICEIDKHGKLVKSVSAEAIMSQKDNQERQAFADYMKHIGKQAKQEDFLLTSIKTKKCIYSVKLRDSFRKEETWLIVQQVGFQKPVGKSIVDAFKNHQLRMLPRGGVACLLDSNRSRGKMEEKHKAYCFLPLPFKTNLPVSINGHFALDHEARRNLWQDEAGGFQSDWNNALLRDVIASCYLTLLNKVRGILQLPVEQNGATHNSIVSRSAISVGLFSFERLFPRYPFEDPYWKTLVDSVYQEMNKKEMRLIPVLRRFEESSSDRAKNSKASERVQVTWFPPTGTGKEKTYFNNLEIKGYFAALPQKGDISEDEWQKREDKRIKRKKKFEETLLESGLHLVSLSVSVFDSFREAGVEVFCVSPSAVMDFYKSFSDADSLCNVGRIPCPVDETPFRNKEGVIRVLKYCKNNERFLENLFGLPLLLTQDNYLRVFRVNNPPCLSHYADILPSSPSLFVHRDARSEVFNNVDFKKVPALRPLDVQIFSSQLHLTLPGCFRSKVHHMRWRPDDSTSNLPNRRWIYRVWDFLSKFAMETMEKSDVSEENKISFIRDLLSPLSEWSILPATETRQLESPRTTCSLTAVRDKQTVEENVLSPLNMAESVVDFLDCGSSCQKLVEVLRKLGLPELNSFVITTVNIGNVPYTKTDSYEFARNLVSTIKTPHSLLFALKQKLNTNPSSLVGKIECQEAEVVLNYFSGNTNALTYEDKKTVRKLPFFPLVGSGHGKTDDRKVFVLPCEIPEDGMDVIQSRLGCLFVESRERLLDLYNFLGFRQVSPAQVYLRFVLKCFPHLSAEAKLAHLGYLHVFILSTSVQAKENEEHETEQLLEYLKIVEFIPSMDGSSKTASSFYDPRSDFFRAMLSEDKDSFPPNPFDSDEWLSFLEKIGLVTDVSQEDFLKFANQVAQEAATARTEKTYMKSEILVHHLISRRNVVDEGLLRRVCDIPFVAAQPVKKALQDLCPPFGGKKDDEIPFIAFKGSVVGKFEKIVWTKTHLLPNWAVPTQFHSYDIGCPIQDIDRYRYLNDFLFQLQILKEPSIDLVVSHCQKLCSHFGSNSKRGNFTDERRLTITAVMKDIYTFLQERAITDRNVKMILSNTPCILVEQGQRFILPSQAILDLYEGLEIKPFLYRVPPEFGAFQRFFEFLGCSKTTSCWHYAKLLEMLHNNCQDAKLDPDEVKTCSKAVKGFFDSLQDDTIAVSTLSKLYLPAMPSGHGFSNMSVNIDTIPVTLKKSTELIFDDAPTYGNRIQGLQQHLVLELSLMNVSCKSTMVSYKDLMMKLPPALQPKMLSCVVKEKLSDPENKVIVKSETVDALRQQLSSAQFGPGIARIIRHVNSQSKDFDEQVILSIERELRSIELFAVENLRTSLFHDGVLIPDSEAEVQYFKEKQEISGVETWRVYVNSLTGMDGTISTLVTKIIVDIYGDYLGKETYAITGMLNCLYLQISPLLDAIGILRDDWYSPAEPLPQPQEAKRWFRQAEADLVAGANEIAFKTNSYEWACLKCHQAAEKALKAVQYKEDANQKTNDHNLYCICRGFNDGELTVLAGQLERLVGNSARMRYPDEMPHPKIPNDVYTAEHAEEALKLATKILDRVRKRLN